MPSLPPDLEPVIWAGIDSLTNIAPEGQSIQDEYLPYTYLFYYMHAVVNLTFSYVSILFVQSVSQRTSW